jgi:DNA-binding transcriptional LysR family regulator
MSKASLETHIGRRLRFRDLQVFFAVAECGGMAKAAAQLGLTQPAVSETIAGIESAFAVRLFDRTPHGVELTIYGRALLKRGRAAFDELKQGMRDIEFLANPTVGEVRIGCPESIAGALLPPLVRQFCLEYPRIALRVDPLPTPTLELPDLHARKLDLVVSRLSMSHARDPFGEDLNVEVLFDDPPVVAAGANSRWARRRKIDLSELVDEPWVATPRETWPTMAMEQAFKASNLPIPRIRVTTFSLQLRTHLLATGSFLTAMPRSLLRLSADGIRLKALPVKLPICSFPVAIVTLKNRTLSPVVELFLERLRKSARDNGFDQSLP